MKAYYLFLLLLFPFNNYAQKEASFSNLSMENGLSQNSVVSIAQDHKNFLWFGTRRGLNRYDGFQFKVYTNNPKDNTSIPHNVIDCLLSDSFGQLWIGTIKGLSRYDDKNDNFIKIKILNDTINCIYEDPDKNLWVGTYNGLSLLDRKSGKFKTFRFNKLDKNQRINNIYSLFKDNEQNLWVGTGYGLIRMTTSNGQQRAVLFRTATNNPTSISSNYITSITSDSDKNIWIGTDKGINLYQKPNKFIHYTHSTTNNNTLIHNDIRDIICNKNGTLWIGTQEGLSILNPKTKTFTNYKHNPDQTGSLTQNSLHSIFQDAGNTVWVGSFYGGVDALYPYSTGFKTYRASGLISSLSSNIISTIVEDAQHNLWIGTEGGGLNHFDRSNNTYRHYKSIPGNNNTLPSNLVKTILRLKNGNLIIGMHEGLISIFNPASKTFTQQITNVKDTSNSRGTADIMTILEDSNGKIWVGSRDGLNNINSHGDHTLKNPIEKKLRSTYVQNLFEDSNKNIWIGTTKGLHLYDPKTGKLACFTKKEGNPDSLQSDYINCIIQTAKDKYWLGTYFGGVSSYNSATRKFKTYTEKDGLCNNNVLGIIEDKKGNLWISTDNGLSVLNPTTEKFKNYTKSDGLAGNDFNMRSFFKDHNNEFFFGGYNGLTSFYPDQIEINTNNDPIVFTNLKLFNQPVTVNGPDQLLKENINTVKKLTFKHNHNNFSLGFALLNYIRSDKNKYTYKLEGYDKDWINTDIPSASYSNLPSGDYTFIVKGVNNDGTPGHASANISITILPPLWATWWAYLCYLLIFSIILFLTIRYLFVRALLKRSEDVQKMKLNFFTYIAHEIRTPLTLILAPLEDLAKTSQNNIEIHQQVLPIKNNADRLMRLITELMDFRKAETGHLKLHVSKADIISYANEMFLAFRHTAITRNIQYEFIHNQDQISLYFDKGQMEKVLFNLLSNAFKFSNNGGTVTLSITEQEQFIEIKVIDNGKGIPYESQNKLFSDYFQVDEQESNHIGSGIGLALSKSIIEAHHGKIEIISNPANNDQLGYTCFIVRLKKGNSHFKPHELSEVKSSDSPSKLYMQQNANEEITRPKEDSKNQETILMVEDNAEIMHLIAGAISKHYRTKESVDGLKGWETAIELLPDLIICDVMMPIMDGLELCRKLKTDERTSHIPIILLTARSSHIHQVSGLETGADAYITKPFSMDLLLLNVRNLLQSRATMRQKFIQQVNLQPQDITINSTDHAFMIKILGYIESHMSDESFGVPELAQKIGMSQPVLYKKIRTMTSLSVNDFIKSIKLKKAAQLLTENRYTISEISYLVGFSDPKYFSREFKKQYGHTPRMYLKTL